MNSSVASVPFVSQPELLLLDEPTNHLDLDAVIWLQQHLAESKQTAVIVSHDQHFLNAVVAEIILLEGKQLHYFEGGYDSFKRRHAPLAGSSLAPPPPPPPL